MKTKSRLLFALFLAFCMRSAIAVEWPVVTQDIPPQLQLKGKPLRAIGVNYYNSFLRVLRNPEDKSYQKGFDILSKRGIPFVRFVLCGFFPEDMKLYLLQRERFFALLDEYVRTAEQRGIGLIPSFFFAYWQVPDIVGEPMQAWSDPNSETLAFMRRFTEEVVTRYKNSPAIWGWEFGNEMAYYVDIGPAARPRLAPLRGTPRYRTSRDDLRSQDMSVAQREFARSVRRIDSTRLISTGNALPRADAFQTSHRGDQRNDSRDEFFTILNRDNPEDYNAHSLHLYPHSRYFRGENSGFSTGSLMQLITEHAHAQGQVLFVGEFGVPTKLDLDPIEERRRFGVILDGIVSSGVPLSAVWDFDHDPEFDAHWNTYAPKRRYQLDAVERLNRDFAGHD
jgi:hypothetical protein